MKALRAEAEKYNPILADLVHKYAEENGDNGFVSYMQLMIDSFMMHECGLGRVTR